MTNMFSRYCKISEEGQKCISLKFYKERDKKKPHVIGNNFKKNHGPKYRS